MRLEAAKAGLRKQRWLDKQRVVISSLQYCTPCELASRSAAGGATTTTAARATRPSTTMRVPTTTTTHGGDDYGGGDDDDNNLSDFSDNNSDGQCGA